MVKKIIYLLPVIMLLVSCSSTKLDNSIISHQRELDRVEEGVRIRDRAIESSIRRLEAITARSESMGGTIEETIELFDEYQRAVEQLIREYRAAGNNNKVSAKGTNHSHIYITIPAGS